MPIDLVGGYSAFDQMNYSGNDPYALAQSSQVQQGQDAAGQSAAAVNTAPMDQQTFGAAVVSKTLDYMNGQGSSSQDLAPMDKQTFGAAVVSKTLDYMNSGNSSSSAMAQNYDFQKSVLGGPAEASGALFNIKT